MDEDVVRAIYEAEQDAFGSVSYFSDASRLAEDDVEDFLTSEDYAEGSSNDSELHWGLGF